MNMTNWASRDFEICCPLNLKQDIDKFCFYELCLSSKTSLQVCMKYKKTELNRRHLFLLEKC